MEITSKVLKYDLVRWKELDFDKLKAELSLPEFNMEEFEAFLIRHEIYELKRHITVIKML